MHRILSFLLLVLLAGNISAQDWSKIVETWGPSVCKIEIRSPEGLFSTGTGFLVSKDGKIITNAHVVEDSSYNKKLSINVTFPFSSNPNQIYGAEIVRLNSDTDLSLLKVSGDFANPLSFGSPALPGLMTEIIILGYPLGKNFKSTPGYIQALQDIPQVGKMLDLSSPVDPGNSGGPVLNKQGQVLGIVTSRYEQTNFNLAMPAENILNFINANILTVREITSEPEGSRVLINGFYKGLTPLKIDMVDQEVEITMEKDGYNSVVSKIQPRTFPQGQYKITLTPLGNNNRTIKILTNPPGALLFIDNNQIGKSPLDFTTPVGSKIRIKIVLDGYKEIYSVVDTSKVEGNLEFILEKYFLFW